MRARELMEQGLPEPGARGDDGLGARGVRSTGVQSLHLACLERVQAIGQGLEVVEQMNGCAERPAEAGRVDSPRVVRQLRLSTEDRPCDPHRDDAYGFFAGLGDLVATGPTLTNVNDFRAVLVAGQPTRTPE